MGENLTSGHAMPRVTILTRSNFTSMTLPIAAYLHESNRSSMHDMRAARVAYPPLSRNASNPAEFLSEERQPQRVAFFIVGQARGFVAWEPFKYHIFRKWSKVAKWKLDVFVCTDKVDLSRFQELTAFWTFPSRTQLQRIGLCVEKVMEYATTRTLQYKWFV